MKKFITIALAACFILGLALPATADVDVKISGEMRVDGVYNDNTPLTTGTKVSDAYYKSRIRIKPVIMVNDNISITTQFDALERTWGTSDESAPGTTGSDDNIDFDYGYATLKTPFGGFLLGRMPGSAWGTKFLDNVGPKDRIVYVLPMDKLIFAAVVEKTTENDAGGVAADEDNDEYYLTATYKAENLTAGLLYGYYNYQQFSDPAQTGVLAAVFAGNATAMAASGRDPYAEGYAHVLSPYVKAKFGPLSIEAEYLYGKGKGYYDTAFVTTTAALNAAGKKEKDIDLTAYMVDANYEIGPFSFGGGYAYFGGDANLDDDKLKNVAAFKAGHDWEKTLIMHSNEIGIHTTLGGLGNQVAGATTANLYGWKVFFAQADFDINESMNIGAVYANSKADKVPTTWEDKQGSEIDLKFTWKFLDNVTWTNTAAFFNAGDFYKAGVAAAEVADTYALFSRLAIKF